MKVVHVLLGKANAHSMNGVNVVVHELATRQQARGQDVEVWGLTASPEKTTHVRAYPLRLFKVTRWRLLLPSDLLAAIDQMPADTLFHLHSVFIPEFFAVCRFLRQRGRKWVLTPHGGYSRQVLRRNRLLKLAYLTCFERTVIQRAAAVHALAEGERQDILDVARPLRVVVIPNGQALLAPQSFEHILEGPVFGFCGRMAAEHKGLDLLLEAFSRYRKLRGLGALWLIGDGPDRGPLEDRARCLGLASHVTFFGPLYGEDKLQRLAMVDVFVQPSRWDGMPMGVLEAASLGKALIVSLATNLGPAVCRHEAGAVLETTTVADLLATMERVTEGDWRSRLRRMGEQAHRMIEEEFSWEATACKLSRLYAEVLG